jgi:tripartite-type tricarboxylate transporter receptor subunit TctC
MQRRRQCHAWIVAGLVVATIAAPAMAADFYQGKQLTIVVGFSAGGTYDLGARLYARVLGKHLPGRPTVIVQNMPGAAASPRPRTSITSLPRTARCSAWSEAASWSRR